MNAAWAWPSSAWPSGPSWVATWTAPPTDSWASAACEALSPVTDRSWARYAEVAMLPSTATPRAPPSSRVVSLIAEPTPALSSGTEPMIAPVAGAIARLMPRASRTIAASRIG